jgi:hypothetical protein
LLVHGDYSSISNRRTKILAIFRGIFITFCGVCVYIHTYIHTYIPLFLTEPLT